MNNTGGKNLSVKFFSSQHALKHNLVYHQPELTVKQMHRINNIVKPLHQQQYNIYTNTVLNPQTMYHQVLQALVEASSLYKVSVMNLVATHFNCTSPMDYISHHALHTHIPVHHYTNHTAVTIHSSTLIASPHLHLIHSLT